MKDDESTQPIPYQALSPTDEVKNIDHYIAAIDWALQNRKRIKNIAIAGPSGSGKSSVIQTFQKRNTNKDYHFLNISLATFKDEEDKLNKPDEEMLRLIEVSILQQLLYREEDSKIPDSRFKRIKSYKDFRLWQITIGIILFFISLVTIVFPDFLSKVLLLTIPEIYNIWIHYISLLIVTVGFIVLIFKSIRFFKGIAIKTFSVQNATIEIDSTENKSILNYHLDEILYFFEATEYNIIVIEDLDRFEQTEVFTKLREINLLINNSKKIEKDVVFIYAIRDDIFQNYDRTKFFDFIIPIIPVINTSNSNEQLLKIVESNNYKISDDLLENIALFIDDMRLLYNIMNEYHLYSKNLDESLDQEKLLSMMVYKNIHPDDFTKLGNGQGALYEVISKKHQYILDEINRIDDEIALNKEEIEKLEMVKIKDTKELRTLYLTQIIEKINLSGQSFRMFRINNREYKISEATEDNIFEHFLAERQIEYIHYGNNKMSFQYNFSDIEKNVDNNLSYKEREKLIADLNNLKLEQSKKKVEDLEKRRTDVKKYKLKDVLANKQIEIALKDEKQKELISLLLRNGYIDEDYIYYISFFYEGSLTRPDYQFLLNVKSQRSTEFDYQLYKTEKLIEKLSLFQFEKEYILNYYLVNTLLLSAREKEKREYLFSQLKNESEISIRFIDGFIDFSEKSDLFIEYLCGAWKNIWGFIENESAFSEEKKEKYFKLIIKNATVKDIGEIFDNFKSKISDRRDFLSLIDDTEKIKEIIENLNIKFTDLDGASPENLLDFIYEGDYYVISPKMLEVILKHKMAYKQTQFDTRNYSTIKLSNLEKLIEYIENNIDEYTESVYLKLKQNITELLEYLLLLLNNDSISIENKEEIVAMTETKVDDVNKIDDLDVTMLLLEKSKIIPSWKNIISVYLMNEKQFSDELVSFLNVLENAKALSKERISKDDPDKETAETFIESLLLENRISNESYSHILKSIPYIYSSLEFSKLAKEKVQLLIDNKTLSTENTNFEMLKTHFKGLHISLLEKDSSEFIENIENFNLEDEDKLALLESTKLPITVREKMVSSYDEAIFINNSKLLGQIGYLLLENRKFGVGANIVKSIPANSNLPASKKLEIFNKYSELFDFRDIDELLLSLNEPYSSIAKKGKKPLIENNETTKRFVSILQDKEYISQYKFEKGLLKKGKGIRVITFRK